MPAISFCPRCDRPVMLPEQADPQARVRCPLCEEEYDLIEALRTAPPALVVLDGSKIASVSSRAEEGATIDDWTVEAGDEPAAGELVEDGDDSDLGYDLDEIESEPFEVEETQDFAKTAPFDFGSEEVDQAVSFAPAPAENRRGVSDIPTMAPVLRSRKKSGSFLRQMFGVMVGGVLGLSLGYLLLLWMLGKQIDFLEIGHKLPAFMVPAEFHRNVARIEFPPLDETSTSTSSPFPPSDSFPEPAKTPQPRQENPIAAAEDEPENTDVESGAGLPATVETGKSGGDPLARQGGLRPSVPFAESEPFPVTPQDPAEVEPLTADAETPTPDVPDAAAVAGAADEPKISPPGSGQFTLTQLSDAYAEAAAAQPDLDSPMGAVKTEAYRKFFHLAQVVTLVNGNAEAAELQSRRQQVRELITSVTANKQKLTDLSLIGSKWPSRSPSERNESGVFMAGGVQRVEKKGRLFVTSVQCGQDDTQVNVLSAREPTWKTGDTLVVMGNIIEQPAAVIVGYDPSGPAAVWAGLTLTASSDSPATP